MAGQQVAERVQVGSRPGREERRRSHSSDPVFQNRFRLTLMKLVFVALAPTVALSLVVSQTLQHQETWLGSPWVLIATATACVAAGILILQRCDKLSNRFCGPTYRIRQTLGAIRRGERVQPIRLRANDEFEELAQELNQTFVELGVMEDIDR